MITLLGISRRPFFTVLILSALTGFANDKPDTTEQPTHNEELVIIFQEDQADRQPKDGQMMEGSVMRVRDTKRQTRVMEIYQADELKTGQDYFYAAYVMQHGGSTESYLLAHEFSLASLALGYTRARWIAAASYDRLLKSIGRPQRFGTQYSTLGGAGMSLYQTDDGVRDSLRTVLKVPSLDSARARETDFAKRFPPSTKPIFSLATFAPDRPPPAEFDVLDLKSGDIAPEPLNQPQPEYPGSLLPRNLAGSAFVNAVIERDGTASNIKIALSSHEAFGAAAETAFRQWTFKPGVKQGRPARVIVMVQFNFAPPTAK